MKILFISPTYSGVGGIGPHAFRLSQKLREEGYDIELMKVPHIPIKNLKNLSFSLFGTLKAFSNHKIYDVVHAWGVLHHTGNMAQALRICADLIRPGGYMIVSIYNHHWTSPLWKKLKEVYCFSPKTIKKIII